jgi:hypothetical protein
MIAIPCSHCNQIIDIDVSVEPIKVPCYLLLCQSCQIEAKNNERDKKLKKVLRRGLKERIMEWLR